jgi:hypothetical protein
VEIGSWFPVEFSNSRLLIKDGWDAVLVEFSPLAIDRQLREYGYQENITIIQAAVTPCPQHVQRFEITEDALSTDDVAQKDRWKGMRLGYDGGFYGRLWVPTLTWDALKDQFFPKRVPDFVSVDTEGSSVELAITILQSNWRPKVLCVEHNGRDIKVWQVAKLHGYKIVDKNQENLILCR